MFDRYPADGPGLEARPTFGGQPVKVDVQSRGSGFDDLSGQLWAMLNEMQEPSSFRSHAPRTWKPRANLYETSTHFLACLELAGTSAERIDVRAEAGVVHVRGFRDKPELPGPANHESAAETVSVLQMEIDWGRFHRSIRIGSDVDVERIQALYRHGYLWVILPRTANP